LSHIAVLLQKTRVSSTVFQFQTLANCRTSTATVNISESLARKLQQIILNYKAV